MQHARLLKAAILTIDELGWADASVAHITSRARVSRRTFYELFVNREDCLIAAVQDVIDRVVAELTATDLPDLPWRERVRTGLWQVLCFFDREPVLARICVVQSAGGGRRVLEAREEILARVASVIDEGRLASARAGECPVLTAEGLAGAGIAILYTRLLRGGDESLSDLVGELMSMIVLPYLGPAAARQERVRALPATVSASASDRNPGPTISHEDPLRDVPMRLTYRTARVLEVLAAHPGASNRAVGEHAGISDQGQVSKLLARLRRIGLLQNTGQGHTKGEPNEWRLTPTGRHVTQSVISAQPKLIS